MPEMGDLKIHGTGNRADLSNDFATARNPFGSNRTSPPGPSFRSDMFSARPHTGQSKGFSTSPTNERYPGLRNGGIPNLVSTTSDPAEMRFESHIPAVLIRRLPLNIGGDAVKSMLIFAGVLHEPELITSPYPEDKGFATAIARFQDSNGALKAQQELHGKPNTTNQAAMIVEPYPSASFGGFERRNTIDGTASRNQSSSTSSGSSIGAPPTRSRFGSTFQSVEKISPPLSGSNPGINCDFPMPERSNHFKNLFSTTSPLTNGDRISGKSVINDDLVDDETGELLKDPVAYAKSGQQQLGRRSTNPAIPVGAFGGLSLGAPPGVPNGMLSGMTSPVPSGMTSPRGMPSAGNPMSPMSPSQMSRAGANGSYMSPTPRAHFPPVNPADQNPPCNTLYVGNLPMDTSEDELKQIFSKQRGYRRLCFRTKQNGPMCFVEFEDITFASKALDELYGHLLSNSNKGGIRLSFSKNPLGVRSGQSNGLGPSAVMSPQSVTPGYGMMNGANFSTVSGPPPGISTPPGLMNGFRPPPAAMDGAYAHAYAVPTQDFVNQLGQRNYSGGIPPSMGNGTYGRDLNDYHSQLGHNNYGDYNSFGR